MLDKILVLISVFVVAFLLTFGSTPIVRVLAFKLGAVDVPKDERRIHKKPIARMGGLAIFYGFLISVLVFNRGFSRELISILIGSAFIVAVGILDDIYQLRAIVKLMGQIFAAAIVIFGGGVKISVLSNPLAHEGYTNIGWLYIPLTFIWIVGVTNAINLIDGVDGLAAGVASIASTSICFISIYLGNVNAALITIAVVGACFGFLPYNTNPAKIFMGDTGSMFLGFILASVSITGLFKSYAVISLAIPILILGLPLFDTTFAIIRRIIHGEHIMAPDRGHLHHRLLDAGFTQKQVVLILYCLSGVCGITGVLLSSGKILNALILVAAVLVIIMFGLKYMAFDMRQAEEEYKKN